MKKHQTIPSLRGLDARCMFAVSKVVGRIYGPDSDEYSKHLFDSLIAAQDQGKVDGMSGISEIPQMLSSEIALAGAWKDGFFEAFKDSFVFDIEKE